jgi:hypothetical protein
MMLWRRLLGSVMLVASLAIIGCGGPAEDGSATEGAPPPPEAGTDSYDAYSGGGKGDPNEKK